MASFDEIGLRLPDGYRAYARYWSGSNPRGAVLYHHGIQSHCGWYEASPARLAEAGYAVLQVDRRGCGRNSIDRGHAESADQLIGDAQAAHDELAQRSGHDAHHVVGVSWGGKLAVAAYVKNPSGVLSLSLVTPGLFPLDGVTKEAKTKIGFAMLYERQRSFDIPLNDPVLFTSVPQWQAFFRSDPLTLRQCTASFYLASRRMDKIVARLPEAPRVPVHLFLAGDEHIIDNPKTEAFVTSLHGCQDRVSRYETARHSLEFEGVAETYLADLVSFIRGLDGFRSA